MFTSKKKCTQSDISSENFHKLSDDDIKKIHEVILEIYDDLFAYCEKHSLKLIAGGGTALGAVRHKGFIPWDDDMDLNLIRADYEKFISHFEEELGDKYDLLAPGYARGSACFLMRVYKKNTTLLNMIDETTPYPAGIYIDITPIDFAPNSKILQRLKGIIADSLRIISYCVFWKQYKSKSLEEFLVASGKAGYYRFRIFIGTLFCFKSAENWFKEFNSFIKGQKSDYVTVAAGRKLYYGEIYSVNTFFPVIKVPFENREIYVYNNVHAYLKKMYGDYMKIPDKKNREGHVFLKLDFNKSR